jgi:selenocysteine lyase/cysteine desulfurase
VAQSWGRRNIGSGDEIAVSLLKHHANIVTTQDVGKALNQEGIAVRAGHPRNSPDSPRRWSP